MDGRNKSGHDKKRFIHTIGSNSDRPASFQANEPLLFALHHLTERQMFEPGTIRDAFDPVTGIKLSIHGTADIDTKVIRAELPDGRIGSCAIMIETEGSIPDGGKRHRIRLFSGSLNCLAELRNGSRRENTEFVRYILSGVSLIHRTQPIIRGGYFSMDPGQYDYPPDRLKFDLPTEIELNNL